MGQRGASILASLVLVAMLGSAALVADFANYQGSSQTAASGVLAADASCTAWYCGPNPFSLFLPSTPAKQDPVKNLCTANSPSGKIDPATGAVKKVGMVCEPKTEALAPSGPQSYVAKIKDQGCKEADDVKAGTCYVKWCIPGTKPQVCSWAKDNKQPELGKEVSNLATLSGLSPDAQRTALDNTLRGQGSTPVPISSAEQSVFDSVLNPDPGTTGGTPAGADTAPCPGTPGCPGHPADSGGTATEQPTAQPCPAGQVWNYTLNKCEQPQTLEDTSGWYCKSRGGTLARSGECVIPQTAPPDGKTPPDRCQQNPTANGCQCPAGFYGTRPDCIPERQQTFPRPGDGGPKFTPPSGGGPQSLGPLAQALGQMLGLGPQCAKTQQEYQQQQQQYQQQLQQYNYQRDQWYYYQQQQQYYGYGQSSNPPPRPPTQPPAPCFQQQQGGQPQQGQNCPQTPPQPSALSCQNGTWKPTQSGACTTGWQCVPGGAPGGGPIASTTPTAQISCQPRIADVGMSIAISYSCTNATASVGAGFSTNGALSGSTTTIIAAPPGNTNTATYALTCTNLGRTADAQCSVQVAKLSIVLVANPEAVQSGKTSALGWVTSGMKSCVISSPDLPDFTSQNASNTSVNGTATTPPLTSAANFVLKCVTLGGGTREASTKVKVL